MTIEGDLRVIEGPEPRVCFVVRDSGERAEVLLVHTFAEYATDHDLIVAPEATSTPYPVVIQQDLRTTVASARLGKRVGRVCGEATPGHLPLRGVADGRWWFKAAEGEALRALQKESLSWS